MHASKRRTSFLTITFNKHSGHALATCLPLLVLDNDIQFHNHTHCTLAFLPFLLITNFNINRCKRLVMLAYSKAIAVTFTFRRELILDRRYLLIMILTFNINTFVACRQNLTTCSNVFTCKTITYM